MTNTLGKFLYEWAKKILISEFGLPVTIIESHQDNPLPAGIVICIDYAADSNSVGQPDKIFNAHDDDMAIVRNMLYLSEIREISGDGSYLNLLVESLDRPDIVQDWNSGAGVTGKSFSCLSTSGIRHIPVLKDDEKWRRESIVELTIHERSTVKASVQQIIDVEYNGHIPAQGRSGTHN